MAEMTDAAREARRAYKREWNHKNRDKVQAAQMRYWERKAAEMEAAEQVQAEQFPADEHQDLKKERSI